MMRVMAMVTALFIPLSANATGIPVPNVPKVAVEVDGPRQVASHFMGQFFDVEPEQVATTVLDMRVHQASVRAETEGGEVCTFEVEKIPNEIEGRDRWLVGSIHCN